MTDDATDDLTDDLTDDPYPPVVRTQQDLETMGRTLMGPLGFAEHSVWLAYIDADDRLTPVLTQIQDFGTLPSDEERAGLGDVLRRVRDDSAGTVTA